MKAIIDAFHKVRETFSFPHFYSSSSIRIGDADHEYSRAGSSYNIACKNTMLNVYESTRNDVGTALKEAIERAKEVQQLVVTDLNRRVVIVGPGSSVADGKAAYDANFKSVSECFTAYAKAQKETSARPQPPTSTPDGYGVS